MYIGQWTQAWQSVYCFRSGILRRVVPHQVVLHQAVLHRVVLRFDDAEVFVNGVGANLDYLPDLTYFRLFCSLIKSVNSWQSGIALGMYRPCYSLHCRITMSGSISL
jgi:hypothetical protein